MDFPWKKPESANHEYAARYADALARLITLESQMKSMQIEWDEMYDKFRRLLARISKRHDALETAEKAAESHDTTDPRQLSLSGGDRQAELNQMIRNQRGRSALPTSRAGEG